jgi:hypothetical protein
MLQVSLYKITQLCIFFLYSSIKPRFDHVSVFLLILISDILIDDDTVVSSNVLSLGHMFCILWFAGTR